MKRLSRLTKEELMQRIKHAHVDSEIHATDILKTVSTVVNKMFHKDISQEVRPLFFRNGTVTFEASSSIIAQEVRLQEEALKEAINIELGKKMVRHFLWRIVST